MYAPARMRGAIDLSLQRLVALAFCLLVAACDPTSGLDVPTLVDAESPELPGKFVAHSLVTTEPESAKAFYGLVFGWTFEPVGDGRYIVAMDGSRVVGGIVDATGWKHAPDAAAWLGAVSVPKVDAAVATAKQAGAKQLLNILDVPYVGRTAVLSDPEGAVFQVIRATDGDPPDHDPVAATWLWDELSTTDVDAAARFYQKVFGYRIDLHETRRDAPYLVLSRDAEPRAGIRRGAEERPSAWIPYVRVDDPASLVAKVVAFGGSVVEESSASSDDQVAVIVDPSGATLALQRWTPGALNAGDFGRR